LQTVGVTHASATTKSQPAIIVTLSILTRLGSVFGVLRGLFYQTFARLFESSTLNNDDYNRGYVLMLLNAGTLIAAILMLRLKSLGFNLYLLFQSAYLAFTFYIVLIYSTPSTDPVSVLNGINPFAMLVGAFFWLPSFILLILYLAFARKYFSKKYNQSRLTSIY